MEEVAILGARQTCYVSVYAGVTFLQMRSALLLLQYLYSLRYAFRLTTLDAISRLPRMKAFDPDFHLRSYFQVKYDYVLDA